jgi:hypothetical protein
VRIGYSFWGFLGPGVVDTPDGGRSHRRVLVDGLVASGHEIVFLQANRDLDEAGLDLTGLYGWDAGLPDVDSLFLEWRWPIPGRNTTPCGTAGHTCDLHRQRELLDHYTDAGTPTIVWDKDRQLAAGDSLRRRPNVVVGEAALHPSPGAVALLFPVADDALDRVEPSDLTITPRDLALAYVGNQYDRDDAFDAFFAPAAARLPHVVAGKWTRIDRWPHVHFIGRIPFPKVSVTYGRSLATITLLPERLARAGQMTQRLFEAVLAGCLPLTPTTIRSVDRFAPSELHVADADDVVEAVRRLAAVAGTDEHVALLSACVERLDLFRASRQLLVIDQILAGATASAAARGA